MATPFHPGTISGEQKRDESGLSAVEFVGFLRGYMETHGLDQQEFALHVGIDEGQLSSLLNGKQQWVSLKVVDRILVNLQRPELLQEFTVIPGPTFSDAKQMAYYEFLDENDEPLADEATIMERAEELAALREMMLSGDDELIAFAKDNLVR